MATRNPLGNIWIEERRQSNGQPLFVVRTPHGNTSFATLSAAQECATHLIVAAIDRASQAAR